MTDKDFSADIVIERFNQNFDQACREASTQAFSWICNNAPQGAGPYFLEPLDWTIQFKSFHMVVRRELLTDPVCVYVFRLSGKWGDD